MVGQKSSRIRSRLLSKVEEVGSPNTLFYLFCIGETKMYRENTGSLLLYP